MKEIIDIVCYYQDVSSEQLFSKSRKAEVVKARFLCWYFIRKNLKWSYARIGIQFGGREHGTIMHGIRDIDFRYEIDEDDRELIRKIWLKLKYDSEDFTQTKYKEILSETLKQDYKLFCKLNIPHKTRKWIYEDLKIDKELITKIENHYEKMYGL